MVRLLTLTIIFLSAVTIKAQRSAFYDLAKSRAEQSDFNEAIRLMKISVDMDLSKYGDGEEVLDELAQIIFFYSKTEDSDSILHYAFKAWPLVESLKTSIPEASIIYGQNIVISLTDAKEFKAAERYGLDLLNYMENRADTISIPYCQWMASMADVKLNRGKYEEAISMAKRALSFAMDKNDENDINYCAHELYHIYYFLSENDVRNTATDTQDLYCLLRDNNVGKETQMTLLIKSLNQTLDYGSLRTARSIYVDLQKVANSPEFSNIDRIPAWLAMARYDLRAGDTDGAKFWIELTWHVFEQENISPNFNQIQDRILIENEMSIDPDWVITTADSLLASRDFMIKGSENYPDYEKNLLSFFWGAKGFAFSNKKALIDAKKSIEQAISFKENESLYNKLGNIELQLHNYDSSESCYIKALSLSDGVRRDIQDNLCSLYWVTGNKEKMSSLVENLLDDNKSMVRDNFGFMTAEEREMFNNSNPLGGWLNIGRMVSFSNGNSQWAEGNICAYNTALWSKGLLLSSERESRLILSESPDSIKGKMNLLKELDNKYNLGQTTLEENIERSRIKHDLMIYIEKDPRYLSAFNCDWKQIRDALAEHEAAIEFIEYGLIDKKTLEDVELFLGALIVSKELEFPYFVTLGNKESLNQIIPKDVSGVDMDDLLYTDSPEAKMLTEFIWSPLSKIFDGKSKIYYSPDGIIHRINVDYVRDSAGNFLSDKMELIRVSSTRSILGVNKYTAKEAILYGDVPYSSAKVEGQNDNGRKRGIKRSGFHPLPSTKAEIRKISELMASANLNVHSIVGLNATEESFHAFSGYSPKVLHLATHGFFYSNEQARQDSSYITLMADLPAMYRSGLAFQGAQNKWMNPGKLSRETISMKDGILLSQEISTLDFSGTDLVVLSACQTALGATDYDGIFGLQRGFKLAGVNSILMSLWSVDDAATEELMTKFYEYILSGYGKRESLKLAQKHLSNNGFSDPDYWAGWILLDALD